jgi:uncharacterized protein (TIGR02391 family)
MSSGLHFGNMLLELDGNLSMGGPPYGPATNSVKRAVMEALAWLEAQVLIVPAEGSNGSNGWKVLSRAAEAMNTPAEFEHYRMSELLPREFLHPSIAERVWLDFVRGNYDGAVFTAMRQVEIAVREASGADPDWPGVKVARFAFKPLEGPLSDLEAGSGEQQGMMDLFAGALGALKNPGSHRVVNFESPAEAAAVVLTASQLLRIAERQAAARAN